MPALVTCRGTALETQWNVGSDDFVLSSILVVALSLLSSILVMASLAALYLSPGCPNDQGLPPLLYWSFFFLLAVQIGIMIDETVIMSISYRGRIWNSAKRDSQVLKYIYVRFVLLVLEFFSIVLCFVATFDRNLIGPLDCSSYRVAVALAQASSVLVLLKCTGSTVRLFLFLDPCGLFTPGLLQHLSFLDTADDIGEMPQPLQTQRYFPEFLHFKRRSSTRREAHLASSSPPKSPTERRLRRTPNVVRFWQHQVSISQTVRGGYTMDEISRQASRFRTNYIGLRRIQRRLRIVFCCLGVGGQRSRGVALEDVGRALYTLFDFEEEEGGEGARLVLSDVISGFKLVNQYQRSKMERLGEGERLEDKFRKVTFDRMPVNQKPHYIYKPPRTFLNEKPEYHLLVDNMIHYMQHSMGMYGWPLHVFSNLACGLCQLASRTCCECRCVGPGGGKRRRVEGEGRCGCELAAMTIQTGVERDDILFLSTDNEIFKAPFAVVLDRRMRSVVVTVRGTLSIKDALTDMSYSMQPVDVDGVNETFVHKGMYIAADEIQKKLMGRSRQEIRLEAIRRQGGVTEEEVDRLMDSEKRILPQVFQQYKDYQLIVSGHSLGAGAASVLALLLRKDFPDLHCYAYSPPGCVFSYPLAVYSRKFTTSVVLGSDVVPRVSFRSLLYLKQSVKHLLQHCDKPKFNVLFQPKWCGGGISDTTTSQEERSQSTASLLPEGFESLIVGENTTGESLQNAVFPPTHIRLPSNIATTTSVSSSRQVSVDLLDNPDVFEREISDHVKNMCGQFMPTFPPGKIFHLKVNKSAPPCCLGYCYPNQLEMERLRNEDLCMIMIDRGAVDDHLPNHVLASLMRFKRQNLAPTYSEEQVETLREEAWRDMQQKRKARALSNERGRWVFPTTPVGNTSTTQSRVTYTSQSSSSSSTPDTASHQSTQPTDTASVPIMDEATPSNLDDAPIPDRTPPTNVGGSALHRFSGTNTLSTIPEEPVQSESAASPTMPVLDTRVVEVEVHKDEEHLASDIEQQHTTVESEAGLAGSCSSPDSEEEAVQAITIATQREDEEHRLREFEMVQLKPHRPPLRPVEPVSLPSLVDTATSPGTQHSVIPVRVPFSPPIPTPQLPSPLSPPTSPPTPTPQLPSPLSPPTSPSAPTPLSPPTSPPTPSPLPPPTSPPTPTTLLPTPGDHGQRRGGRRRRDSGGVLRRLSRTHQSVYGGERVKLTVQTRRGNKLKIIIPTSPQNSVL